MPCDGADGVATQAEHIDAAAAQHQASEAAAHQLAYLEAEYRASCDQIMPAMAMAQHMLSAASAEAARCDDELSQMTLSQFVA